MGAGDSKLSFKKGVFRLAEEKKIPASDSFWLSFWELPETTDDVFSLFSAADIRRTRDSHLENLETLILAVTSRLFVLRHCQAFPDPETAPEKDALNCIRVLTRVLPFIYECEKLEEWQERFFWGSRRRRVGRGPTGGVSEVIFDESNPNAGLENAVPEYEDAPPLMEELVDVLIDLLFYSGFTLPPSAASGKSKVTYAIWQSGVGCNTPVGTTRDGENNKIEILRLLLAITGKAMFMPASVLPVKGVRVLTYMTTCGDRKVVLSVLCSLLNTTLKYNPATWRVPYDHVVFTDPRQVLVTYSLQTLLVLLLYPVPESEGLVKNNYRHFLGRLHRTQDFQFCVDGMTRILNQPIRATTSYLPGSQKSLKWAPEMMMLFWEALQCNKRFRSFIIDTDRVHDFVILIIYYALEYRTDPSKLGVVRMCVFVLQTLSTEAKFGVSLNKQFEGQSSLPASVQIPLFSGSYADYLIISIYTLITTSKGKLGAVYPALLAVIANVAPHVKNLSSASSVKLIQLFASMSAPAFLLANETNHTLLESLLESINSIIEHQYTVNPNFIYAILRAHKRFENLRNFTLESGQEELDRENRLRKDKGEGVEDTPKISFNMSEMQRPSRTPATPTTPITPVIPSAFEIGDDSDDDDENDENDENIANTKKFEESSRNSVASPTTMSRTSSVSEMTEDAVPIQLRGMSEKARGKLPEGTFQRQGSTTSLSGPLTPSGGFTPTITWAESWLPLLPLHSTLSVIEQLQPELRSVLQPTSVSRDTAPFLERIRKTELRGIEPSLVRTHMFEWGPLALGWYESLLWGFIFVSERHVSKGTGTVGVWNGTAVRLFKVQETAPEGPSLLAPRGGVDAIGSNLMERLGSVTIGRRDSAQQQQQQQANRASSDSAAAAASGGSSGRFAVI